MKYKLEPSLRDLFVEGQADARFFRHLIEDAIGKAAKVYPIEFINMPAEALLAAGLTEGNKQRVIALCCQLVSRCGETCRQARGLVDADCDGALGHSYCCPLLIVSDFTSLELYAFSARPFSKFATGVLGLTEFDAVGRLNEYAAVLTQVFAFRAAAAASKAEIGWLPFDNYLKRSDSGIDFDSRGYLLNCVNACRMGPQVEAIAGRARDLLDRCAQSPEIRHWIHGHDFVALAWWDLSNRCRAAGFSKQGFERALMSCVEIADAKGHRVFRQLSEWLCQ